VRILVFNCGSSSLKFEFVELTAGGGRSRTIARGEFERIAGDTRRILTGPDGVSHESRDSVHSHAAAAVVVIEWLDSLSDKAVGRPDAVGYRVVHGGGYLKEPAFADDSALRAIERAAEFAPLHNPPALSTIRAVSNRLPKAPGVIVADTMFHEHLPARTREYPISRSIAERHHIRRYGFHGIGHAWMMERYADLSGIALDSLRLVTLHLGAGCSAAAIAGGRSIDTSMGFTPLEGLMMATRSGDIDPAIIGYLFKHEGMTPAQCEEMLNRDSGLAGVAGIPGGDFREVLRAAESGNENAALALEMFCYRIRKYIGAYIAALGGADAIIFGGGIGEHSEYVRRKSCEGLDKLGIMIDPERNRAVVGSEGIISKGLSPVAIRVIPVDEELYIARQVARLIGAR
jgi:acetate kinase